MIIDRTREAAAVIDHDLTKEDVSRLFGLAYARPAGLNWNLSLLLDINDAIVEQLFDDFEYIDQMKQ